MSDAEKAAIREYTKKGYRDMNAALRGEIPMTPELQNLIDLAEAAVNRAPNFPAPIVVYRGLSSAGFHPSGDLQEWAKRMFTPGEVIDLGGFQSATLSPQAALAAQGSTVGEADIVFEIKTSFGAILDYKFSDYSGEHEVLLGPGTHYRVVGVLPKVEFYNRPTDDLGPTYRLVVQLEAIKG